MAIFDTPLETLKFYMKPYYQDVTDDPFLTAFLTKYGSPECAAAELWDLKAVELAGQSGGVESIKNGAESTKFTSAEAAQKNAQTNADKFKDKCKALRGANSSGSFNVARSCVGGIPPDDISGDYYPQ
jgi:hypothetical protein